MFSALTPLRAGVPRVPRILAGSLGLVLSLLAAACDPPQSVSQTDPKDRPKATSVAQPTAPPQATKLPAGVVELTDANFASEVLESKTLVLGDFWAPWCGPCRILNPTIQELAREYSGRVKVCKLNIDTSPKTAQGYQITSIPRVWLFRDGKPVKKIAGLNPKGNYTRILDHELKS